MPVPSTSYPTVPASPKGGVASSMPDLPAFKVVQPRDSLRVEDFRLPDGSPLVGPDGYLVPPAREFSMVVNAATRVYSYRFDEAMRDNWVQARAMRRDAFIRGLLEERILPTINRRWQLDVDDDRDPNQRAVQQGLTKIVEALPQFDCFKRALLDGVWYGRAGTQWNYWRDPEVNDLWSIKKWDPVHGDSIQFTYDGVPAILMDAMTAGWYASNGATQGQWGDLRSTDRGGQALVLQRPTWRNRFAIHQHIREKADYFEGELAGSVQGLGLRGLVYWQYLIRTDALTWMLAYMQSVGQMDMLIFNYPWGNDAAKAQQQKNANQIIGKAAFIVPRNPQGNWQAVEQLSMNDAGLKALHDLISEYFDRHIERLIVGQSMSAGADNESGLGGTGRADFAKATKDEILVYDSNRLDEVLTSDLIKPLKNYNYKWARFPVRFKSVLPNLEAEKKVASGKTMVELKVPIRMDELREAAGFSRPEEGDEVVQPPPDPNAGGPMGGMPGAPTDPNAPPGQPGQPQGTSQEGQPQPAPQQEPNTDWKPTPPKPEGGFGPLFNSRQPVAYGQRHDGEVWQGPSGKWFTLKQNRVVPTKAPGQGVPEQKGAAAKPQFEKQPAQAPTFTQPPASTPEQVDQNERDILINSPALLGQVKFPKKMYHVTSRKNLDSILKNGLVAGQPRATTDGASRGIYLIDNPQDAFRSLGDHQEMGRNDFVVLEVGTEGLGLRLDPEFTSNFGKTEKDAQEYINAINDQTEQWAAYSPASIPASQIKVHDHPAQNSGGGQFTGSGQGGSSPAQATSQSPDRGEEIRRKYKDQQASHEPIKEIMEAHGLTLDDYKRANEALYQHNIASTPEAASQILSLWNSPSPEGQALRLMSAWNEWQMENTRNPVEDLNWDGIRTSAQKAAESGNWNSWRKLRQGGDLCRTPEEYFHYLDALQTGQHVFYRKGEFDKPVISMTTDPKGANTGSGRFKPDRFRTYDDMKRDGYTLLAGARGMVGVTSSREQEYIWLKTGQPTQNSVQQYDAAPAPAASPAPFFPGGSNTYLPGWDKTEIGFTRLSRGQEPTRYVTDATGHEHKGAGPGGGQFTGSGGGDSSTENQKETTGKPSSSTKEVRSAEDFGSELLLNEYGKPSGTKDLPPTTVKGYRVGETEDKFGRGLFFSGDRAGAEAYASLHPGHEVKEYEISLQRPILVGHQNDLCEALFNKTYSQMYSGGVEAGRKADVKIAKELAKRGYDGIIYLRPAPPARTEVALLKTKGKSGSAQPIQNARGETPTQYGAKLGCVMIPLQGQAAIELLDRANLVRDCDLADDGREEKPHVTVRFGFEPSVRMDQIEAALRGKGPFEMTLGGISCFYGADSGKDYDVVKVDVTSPQLRAMNSILGRLPCTDTHKDYKPHATIAYVKKGLGDLYRRLLAPVDLTVVVDELVYSDADKVKSYFKLRGLRTLPESIRYAAAHAPAGGVSVAGKQFTGGQFIPGDVMAEATPEERAKVEGESGGKRSSKRAATVADRANGIEVTDEVDGSWLDRDVRNRAIRLLDENVDEALRDEATAVIDDWYMSDLGDSGEAAAESLADALGDSFPDLADAVYGIKDEIVGGTPLGYGKWGLTPDGERVFKFKTAGGGEYEVTAENDGEVTFNDPRGGFKVTGAGNAHEVLSSVTAAVVSLVTKTSPNVLTFTAKEPSRQRLYDRLVQTVSEVVPGYEARSAINADGEKEYVVAKKAEPVSPTTAQVLSRLPRTAYSRLASRVTKFEEAPTVEAVTDAWYAGEPNPPPPGKRVACYGFYDPADGRLLIGPGGPNVDQQGTLAHEIGHALDQSDDRRHFQLSGDPEFVAAWRAEMGRGQLSNYARTDEVEGFAEFGRLLWGTEGGQERARSQFPRSYAYFKRTGLVD